jgi:hypothetical protein
MSRTRIIVILVTASVLGASADAMLSYWLDPLRPSRLEQMGVVANYNTGALRFTKSMQRSDAESIHDEFIQRLRRQDILARAEPGPATIFIEATGFFFGVLMGPFFLIAIIVTIIYILTTIRRPL